MKDTKELRAFLIEQMADVAEGRTDVHKAKAISNLAQQVYNTLNIEAKIALARDKVGEIGAVDF